MSRRNRISGSNHLPSPYQLLHGIILTEWILISKILYKMSTIIIILLKICLHLYKYRNTIILIHSWWYKKKVIFSWINSIAETSLIKHWRIEKIGTRVGPTHGIMYTSIQVKFTLEERMLDFSEQIHTNELNSR